MTLHRKTAGPRRHAHSWERCLIDGEGRACLDKLDSVTAASHGWVCRNCQSTSYGVHHPSRYKKILSIHQVLPSVFQEPGIFGHIPVRTELQVDKLEYLFCDEVIVSRVMDS
jgi:hypothetical protein